MPRLFSGIELPPEIRDQLSALDKPLPGARWIDEDDLHLTLRFFGDVSARLADELTGLLQEIDVDAFELRLEGVGTFGGNEPRVIWAGVAPSPALDLLARANETAARSAGLPAENRAFKPHVTLARLRGTPPELVARLLGRIGAFRSAPFPVTRFALFSSKPQVGGGPYLVEAAFALRGAWFDAADDETTDHWR